MAQPNGGAVTIWGELWRTDKNGVPQEDLTEYVTSGSVDWHGDRTGGTPMGCQVTFRRADLLTAFADYIMPYLNLVYDDGTEIREPMGRFIVMPFAETHDPVTAEVTVTGRDMTYLLAMSKFLDTGNYAASSNLRTNLVDLIEDAGYTKHVIPTTTKTLSKAKSFRVGTSRLDAANHFAHRFGWYKLFMERDGYIRTLPYRSLINTQPAKLYTEDHLVDVLSVNEPPADKFANVVIVQRETTDGATLTSVARQDNPAVPWSTEALGIEIVKGPETVDDAEDQTALDAIAAEMLDNAGAYEKIVTIRTLPDPYQEINRTADLYLQGDKEHLNGRYRIRGWKVGFTPENALVEVEMSRVARFVTGVLEPGQGLLGI